MENKRTQTTSRKVAEPKKKIKRKVILETTRKTTIRMGKSSYIKLNKVKANKETEGNNWREKTQETQNKQARK